MKVKQTTVYESEDGRVFDNQVQCIEYETNYLKVKRIMSQLNKVPKDCDFGNGHGYIQQEPSKVNHAIKELLELIEPIIGEDFKHIKWNSVKEDPFKYRMGIIGRYIDDSNDRTLNGAWCRFMNMDNNYREWGQCYYALHPDQGKQIKLNEGIK